MKKILLAAAAAITFASPLAATNAFADPPGRHDVRGDRGRDNRPDVHRAPVRQIERWDARRHNGYSVNGRWFFGAPTAVHLRRADFHPGYRAWRRGDRLSTYHRSHVRVVDYRRERLRAPPRGYQYVRDDRGDVLLVGIATGLILSAILAN